MNKFLLIIILFCPLWSFSQEAKTHAFFMVGDYSFKEWEKLEFDTFDDYAEIKYSYAKKEEGSKLKIIGTKVINNIKCIEVRIPGMSNTYFISPNYKSNNVKFFSSDGSYSKNFKLGYEGPVDGIGTYCGSCANEPKDAFEIVNYFLH